MTYEQHQAWWDLLALIAVLVVFFIVVYCLHKIFTIKD